MTARAPAPRRYLQRGETQGRCYSCGVRHIWPTSQGLSVSVAKCPACGFDLHRTTHLVRCPVVEWPHGLGVTVTAPEVQS